MNTVECDVEGNTKRGGYLIICRCVWYNSHYLLSIYYFPGMTLHFVFNMH